MHHADNDFYRMKATCSINFAQVFYKRRFFESFFLCVRFMIYRELFFQMFLEYHYLILQRT